MIIKLNIKQNKTKAIKLLEDSIILKKRKKCRNLDEFVFGNHFLDTTPKVQSMKEKFDKQDSNERIT